MTWIIVLVVAVAAGIVLWGVKRSKVLKAKQELVQTIDAVITSFGELKQKVEAADINASHKKTLVANIDRSIDTLEGWQKTALPDVTLFKNHVAPIEKEFHELRESVARELAEYDVLPE